MSSWPAAQRDDHAIHARGREAQDHVRQQRPSRDGDERLRQALRDVAEALRLPAGEDERLHQARRSGSRSSVSRTARSDEAARPIPS